MELIVNSQFPSEFISSVCICITMAKILHNEHINKLVRKLLNFSFIDVKYCMLFYS